MRICTEDIQKMGLKKGIHSGIWLLQGYRMKLYCNRIIEGKKLGIELSASLVKWKKHY